MRWSPFSCAAGRGMPRVFGPPGDERTRGCVACASEGPGTHVVTGPIARAQGVARGSSRRCERIVVRRRGCPWRRIQASACSQGRGVLLVRRSLGIPRVDAECGTVGNARATRHVRLVLVLGASVRARESPESQRCGFPLARAKGGRSAMAELADLRTHAWLTAPPCTLAPQSAEEVREECGWRATGAHRAQTAFPCGISLGAR